MTEIKRFDVGDAPVARWPIHNGVVYLAGQVAGDATQDIAGQTRAGAGARSTRCWRGRHRQGARS